MSGLKILFNSKEEIARIRMMLLSSYGLFFCFLLFELILFPSIWHFFKFGLIFLFFYYYYQTLRELYYTFWSLSAVYGGFSLFAFFKCFLVYEHALLTNVLLLSLIFFFMGLYLLSSPIFYPRVSWWEYDFRFRNELKATVSCGAIEVPARISDIRRNAAHASAFQELALGETYEVRILTEDEREYKFKMKVYSKRRQLVGRPWNYGVKILEDKHSQIYAEIRDIWIRNKLRAKIFKKASVAE